MAAPIKKPPYLPPPPHSDSHSNPIPMALTPEWRRLTRDELSESERISLAYGLASSSKTSMGNFRVLLPLIIEIIILIIFIIL